MKKFIINKEFAYKFLLDVEKEHIKTTSSYRNITEKKLSELNLSIRQKLKLVALICVLKNKEKEIKELAKLEWKDI